MTECLTKCLTCGSAGKKLSFCSKCRKVMYCSKECQIRDWKASHKEKCKKAADQVVEEINTHPDPKSGSETCDPVIPQEVTKLIDRLKKKKGVSTVTYFPEIKSLQICSQTYGYRAAWEHSSQLQDFQWEAVVGLIYCVNLWYFELESEDKKWFDKVGIKVVNFKVQGPPSERILNQDGTILQEIPHNLMAPSESFLNTTALNVYFSQ